MSARASEKQLARLAIAATVALAAAIAPAHAQNAWKPNRIVEIIVPTSAGGGTDQTARTMHSILNGRNALEMVVMNKGGAGGGIAYAWLNRFEGSGHHLSLSTLNLVTNSLTGGHPLSHRDVTAIAHLFSEYPVFVVKADSPIKDGKDLMARLKADSAAHNFAFSPGLGGALHLAAGTALKAAGIDPSKPTMVVYKSAGDAAAAVLGGHVDVGVMNPPVALGHAKAGRVRIIALGAPKRLGGALAQVPTWKEQGFDAVAASWRGVIGPKGMSAAQVAYWERALEEMTRTEAWKQHLEQNARENEFMGSRKTAEYYEQQSAELKALVAALRINEKEKR